MSENDALYFALSAMLMMYFSFEGYLNWLGHLIVPEVWKKEKDFFNRPPYQGTLGKYLYLSKVLVLQSPSKSGGPFQTVKDLQQLRDKAVHPRTESGKRNVKYSEGRFPPSHRSWLSTKVSALKRDKAEKDIEILVNEMHQAARVHYPDLVDTSDPFSGILGFDITDLETQLPRWNPNNLAGAKQPRLIARRIVRSSQRLETLVKENTFSPGT